MLEKLLVSEKKIVKLTRNKACFKKDSIKNFDLVLFSRGSGRRGF